MNLWKKQGKQQKQFEEGCSYRELCIRVSEMLREYTGMQVSETAWSEEVQRNQEAYRRMISRSIRTCCSGKVGDKETVKELIRAYLIRELKLTEEDIDKILPFDQPQNLSARQMMEILLYQKDAEQENRGFELLWKESGWGKGERERIVITEEMVRSLYLAQKRNNEFVDKLAVLSQLLFADTIGLGVIDSFNQQKGCIEEIQLGLNGYAEGVYNYRDMLNTEKEALFFGCDGVHLLIQGKSIWLKCLTFGTEEELQRVLRSLIRDTGAGELTGRHPMIVADTVDGRRVSVSRPPLTDSWVGLIRKFDTVSSISLEKLYGQEAPQLPLLLKLLIRSGRNIAITGEMASGKTTLFRACLKETKEEQNIRVIEAESFELNVRNFLPERNTMTMRVTQMTPAEEVLAFARKTTGQIFAVGEINSAAMAVMTMDLAKIATQMFFSAHYLTTEHMITDFVNAKLCVGGYTNEGMARLDVIRTLGFDIHLQNHQGKRYVRYINEVIPADSTQQEDGKMYTIRTLYQCDNGTQWGDIVGKPSLFTYRKAKEELTDKEYEAFMALFGEETEKAC